MNKKILFTVCATAAMVSAQTTANIDDFEDGDGLSKTGKEDAGFRKTITVFEVVDVGRSLRRSHCSRCTQCK